MRFYFLIIACFCLLASCNQKQNTFDADQSPSIIGGTKAARNAYPFMIDLRTKSGFRNCGASLIHKQWLLTAAHCVVKKDISNIVPVLNSYDFSGKDELALTVEKVMIHPNFKNLNLLNDIALIKIKEITVTTWPISLQATPLDFSISQTASLLGWGDTGPEEKGSLYLQEIHDIPLLSYEHCKTAPQQGGHQAFEGMICAMTAHNQKTSCKGDSGGPVFQTHDGLPVQVGIISWGYGCMGIDWYDSGYTSVSYHHDWIEKTILEN